MSISKIILFNTAFLILLGSTSCEKKPSIDDLPITAKSIHFDELGDQLESTFGPGCVGFQYALGQNGQLKLEDAIGLAILDIDGNETSYTVEHRKSTHSMTKTITAAAMVKALEVNDISIDASIASYLPNRWELVPEVESITFKELMTHTSGLRGTRDFYSSMRDYMEAGGFESKSPAVPLSTRYANVNFTLMRFLIPMVNPIVNPALNETLEQDGDEAFDYLASQGYIAFVRNSVLIPSQINENVGPYTWDSDEDDATRNYSFSDQTISGYVHPDQTLITGAGGWNMNATEYASFINHLFEGALDDVDEELIIANQLGLFISTYNGVEYYDHNGAFTDNQGRGGRAQWIYIPATKTSMVVQVNSAGNSWNMTELRENMLQAYIDSYY